MSDELQVGKTRLTQHSREQLAANIGLAWFQEMLSALRYQSTAAHAATTNPVSEMEHRALTASLRDGFVACILAIENLAQEPKGKPKPTPAAFGELVPETSNPKEFDLNRRSATKSA